MSTTTETRRVGGYDWKRTEAGRTRVGLTCPFCKSQVTAYLWSLAGCGKKCDCGAKFYSDGSVTKDIKLG